jgi:hypothetical protein
MKVLEGLKALEPGSSVPVGELGLPVTGAKGPDARFGRTRVHRAIPVTSGPS